MSNVPFQHVPLKSPFDDGREGRMMRMMVESMPFAESRNYLIHTVLPKTLGLESNPAGFRNAEVLGMASLPVSAPEIFEKMFLDPLMNWKLPEKLVAEKAKTILPNIHQILGDDSIPPYEKIGKFLSMFKEFRDDMPKRIHVRDGLKAFGTTAPSKIGKPYGVRHSALRFAMDGFLNRLQLEKIPKGPEALFPEGNPWSSILGKVKDQLPKHSKYEGLPMPLEFLFKLDRYGREFSHQEEKNKILSSLSPVEKMVMSPLFGNLLEPKTNPWIWQGRGAPFQNNGSAYLTSSAIEKWDKAHVTNLEFENRQVKQAKPIVVSSAPMP
ncbi:MAG TPA: hypothetical protein VIY47_05035, partial [Ignavibacteriaceae bacterium]